MSQSNLASTNSDSREHASAGLIILGSLNIDLVVTSKSIPQPGETVTGGSFFKANGGKGANQAVAAARGGICPVHLIGAVGDDQFGKALLPELEAEKNLHTEDIIVMDGTETGIAAILVDQNGENCISVAAGANHALSPAFARDAMSRCLQHSAVLLACTEVPLETIRFGLEAARGSGLKTILNPAPVIDGLGDESLLRFVDILTPNEHEASQLSGIDVSDAQSAETAGRILQDKGVKTVLITMGEHGVVIVDAGVEIIPAPSVVAVDTTAAGDCFNGVFASQLCEGADLATSVANGVKAASISVTRSGAQPSIPYRSDFLSGA